MVVIALSSQVKCTNAMMSFRKIFRMVDEGTEEEKETQGRLQRIDLRFGTTNVRSNTTNLDEYSKYCEGL